MDRWPGKYVIGLTGSIGTGKSVVRRMLEHLGGLGIDADALAHRVYARGTPGNDLIVQAFGREVLAGDGEVDRQKLAKVVFASPDAMAELEGIVHPLVITMVDAFIERAVQPVVILEAIKLLETDLASECDAIWVVTASPEVQLQRLVKDRHMSPQAAQARIDSQVPQESRLARADIVIHNDGSIADTWHQVKQACETTLPPGILSELRSSENLTLSCGDVAVVKANPADAEKIAAFTNELYENLPGRETEDILALFGQQSFLYLEVGGELMAILEWKAENLIALGLNFVIDPLLPLDDAFTLLVHGLERQASQRQCEVIFLFLRPGQKHFGVLIKEKGFRKVSTANLENNAWRDAVKRDLPEGSNLFYKQLNRDLPASSI